MTRYAIYKVDALCQPISLIMSGTDYNVLNKLFKQMIASGVKNYVLTSLEPVYDGQTKIMSVGEFDKLEKAILLNNNH